MGSHSSSTTDLEEFHVFLQASRVSDFRGEEEEQEGEEEEEEDLLLLNDSLIGRQRRSPVRQPDASTCTPTQLKMKVCVKGNLDV